MAPDTQDAYLALVDEVLEHDRRYYVDAAPIIADGEYDALMQRVRAAEAAHPAWTVAWSPTKRVGHEPVSDFPKVTRPVAMLSLDNTYSPDELRAFFDRVVKGLDGDVATFVVEPKIDGFGIELTYKHGVLVLAATRGDGRIGEDVTPNVKAAVKGVPMRLREKVDVTVRGEIYMRKDDFARMNAERARLGVERFKDPRNPAAGSFKQQDPREVAKRPMHAILYEVLDGELYAGDHRTVRQRLASTARRSAWMPTSAHCCSRPRRPWDEARCGLRQVGSQAAAGAAAVRDRGLAVKADDFRAAATARCDGWRSRAG